MKSALLLAVLLVPARAQSAPAPAAAACEVKDPQVIGAAQAYAGRMGSAKCFVDVQPASTVGMRYREYTFFDDGLLLAFSSYGTGTNSAATAAREYYFFPRRRKPSLRLDPAAQTITVVMANGGEVVIDPATALISSTDRGEVDVAARVAMGDRGGIEFHHYEGLLLNAGYAVGRSPTSEPDGESVFETGYGQTCRVQNREIFTYHGSQNDHDFKFDDAALSRWLQSRCPGLRLAV